LHRGLRLPVVSGKVTALLLVACLAVTAVLIPFALRLPRWIELESVLAAWWVVWAAVLGMLLYRGWRVSDDASIAVRPPSLDELVFRAATSPAGDLANAAAGEAPRLLVALAALVAAVLFTFGFVLLVELLIPAVALGLYLLVLGMLARVVKDRRRCTRSVLRSTAWGAIWATAYTAPLALVVLAVHSILSRRG
jgi:hypothetical protein